MSDSNTLHLKTLFENRLLNPVHRASGKNALLQHAAPPVGEGTQDPSSTTKEVETEKDNEIQHTGDHSRTQEGKRNREALVKGAHLMKKAADKIIISNKLQGSSQTPRPVSKRLEMILRTIIR